MKFKGWYAPGEWYLHGPHIQMQYKEHKFFGAVWSCQLISIRASGINANFKFLSAFQPSPSNGLATIPLHRGKNHAKNNKEQLANTCLSPSPKTTEKYQHCDDHCDKMEPEKNSMNLGRWKGKCKINMYLNHLKYSSHPAVTVRGLQVTVGDCMEMRTVQNEFF